MVELLALGPLELWHEGQQFRIGTLKERCVLAVLIHAGGEPVTVDALMDGVWDNDPPPTGVDTLHTYLSRLRSRLHRAVGELAEVERSSGRQYRLRVDPADVDLLRFRRLRKDAGAAAGRGERDLALGLLRTAESAWRGEPLAEFSSTWALTTRARLIEDYRRIREERIRLELELGQHADLIGELHELAAQNPLAQRVIASLMLALYRSGRPHEALALYQSTRRRLQQGQGIEPGAELQELQLRILEQDRTLMETGCEPGVATSPAEPAAPASVMSATSPETRNNLPRDTQDFTGRTSELRILLQDSPTHSASGSTPGLTPNGHLTTALPLTVVHGMPGIGKTALAIHAAHRLSMFYPDGQFYVDLRAYSGQEPCEPAEALGVLLHASGAPEKLPDSLDERAARWREWTARHRALVILDNARDAAQVSPLLPGAATCRVVVTSRNRLAGLDGATSLFLDVMSEAEAGSLFARIVGAARSGDATALQRVVDACDRHPLALQLLASRFRHRHSWDLHHLLDRLTQAADPLDEFDGAVASAFRLSYAELSSQAKELFHRLALHTGPDITLRAAAALVGSDITQIRRGVEELLDCHLLEEPLRDRYRLHDLARAFGLQVGARTEPEVTRREAVERLFAYYLTTAHRADRLVYPHRRTLPLGPERESPYASRLADTDQASVWLAVERANLLAVARRAAAEAPAYAGLFPHVLATSLKLWGTWEIAAELYGAAASALRASGDRAGLARTLVEHADVLARKDHDNALRCAAESLALSQDLHDPQGCADALFQSGRAHLAAGQGEVTLRILDQALMLYRDVDDRHGEAECLNVQGMALYYAGRYDEARQRVRTMLDIHENLGDFLGQARAMNNLGELCYVQGRYEDARGYYERSLALVQQRGGRQEFAILDANLGSVHQATGQTAVALAYFHRALRSRRASGDTSGEASVLISLGTVYTEMGRRGEALLHFTRAEEIARGIGSPHERQRALIGIAKNHLDSGRLGPALKVYEQALDIAECIGFPLGSAHALAGLARTALSSHSIGMARRYGEQAVTIFRNLGDEAEIQSLRHLLGEQDVTGS
ncbi:MULTISPECIES: AfsR/SARP family transcriptional regulator [unclassified Streptomyces]|uniref:AfsR/SARP family transcriptional regulator n=1 Tax=unclassified Streptomyces TaxID=2593676 RepID=UPI003423B340